MAEANIVTIPDDIIEYRTNKRAREDLPKSFLVQFVNGRQRECRRCIACGTNIKCEDSNTTGLRRHREVCNRDRGSKDDQQGESPFARGKGAKIEKGLGDVARLVYDDGIPVNKIVKPETLQKSFKQLNFSKVSKHSINRQLENEYQAMFQIVKSNIAGRDVPL